MKNSKSVFIWNMLGSLVNALSTMVLLMVVGRFLGEGNAGVFSIALAIAQLVATIGLFEVRTFQASDIVEQFHFSDYFTFRLITCLLMIVFSIVYVLLNNFHGDELMVIALMILYKGLDAFADVYHGYFQQKDKLDIAGQSLFFRTTISTLVFILGIMIVKNLIVSVILMNIVSIFWIIMFDIFKTIKFEKQSISFNKVAIKRLFIECWPLCVCSFLCIYLINSPKYAIDSLGNNSMQGIFGYIFMPTSVINLFSIFLLRPVTTSLSLYWNEKKRTDFIKIVLIVLSWIVILTIGAMVGAYFLGIPVLSWFYATDLTSYRFELLIILLGGGFSAMATALYYILTVMRRQKKVLISYISTFLIAIIIVPIMTNRNGIIGASLGYLIIMVMLSLSLCLVLYKNISMESNT